MAAKALSGALSMLWGGSQHAAAQAPAVAPAGEYGAVAQVDPTSGTPAPEDATAAATVVDLQGRIAATESLQDVLPEVPGVRVLSSGTANSLAGLALRGAEIGQTTVLLGDLPLSGPDTGLFDLSFVPPAVLERVEVYRGGAPVWWSDGSIGGVLRLVPRQARRPAVSVTGGVSSYGGWEARGFAAAVGPRLSSVTVVGVEGMKGDYPYIDDGGTRFDASDDVERRRRNAETLSGQALSHLDLRLGRGHLQIVALGLSRQGGVPGPASAPALRAHRQRLRSLLMLGYTQQRYDARTGQRRYRLQAIVGGGYERNRLTDKFAELTLGAPKSTDDGIGNALVRLAASRWVLPWLELTGVGSGRFDDYSPADALSTAPQLGAQRFTGAAALESRFFGQLGGWRLELRPSLRLQGSVANQPGVPAVAGATVDATTVRNFAPTYRVAALLGPTRWLAFTTSLARGTRIPSVLELFGNRTTLLANPRLQAETSLAADAGLTARGRWRSLAGSAELRGFYIRIDDLIRYRRTSQFAAVAENIARGDIAGVEAGTHSQWGKHVDLAGGLTWLHTRNEHGKDLPLRPALVFDVRPELHTGSWRRWWPQGRWIDDLSAFFEVNYTASNFVDPANLVELAGRTWLSTGIRLSAWARQCTVALTMRDLLDARGTDLLGFPLPGRRFAALIGYQKEML